MSLAAVMECLRTLYHIGAQAPRRRVLSDVRHFTLKRPLGFQTDESHGLLPLYTRHCVFQETRTPHLTHVLVS